MPRPEKVLSKKNPTPGPFQNPENAQLSHLAFNAATEGIIVTSADKTILAVNPAFTEITGYRMEEVIGKSPNILQSGQHDVAFYKAMWQQLEETEHWQGEIWNRRKNGEIYPEWLSVTSVRDKYGNISHYIGVFSDITKRKQAEEKIYFRANHDALTGLANRMLFSERLEQAIKQARRTQKRTAVIFIDLNRFKQVNDRLGHNVGDFVLKETAKRLQNCVRETDTVARISGDEFLIMLTDVTGRAEATQVVEKVLTTLSQPYVFEKHSIFVGGSCGITVAPDDGENVPRLLKNADMAMYEAKSSGQNAFHFFNRQMKQSAEERASLEGALKKAIKAENLVIHFQPILDFNTSALVALEALVRWRHPKHGLLFPPAFIPLAEASNLVAQIDRWVIRVACEQIKAWRERFNLDTALSVNVSRHQFRDAVFWDFLSQALSKSGLPPERLILEITESLILNSKQDISQKLKKLKTSGVKTAIDDFGTGYSSLTYLSECAIDFMKIDQSFIHDIESDSKKKALVKTMLRMGKSLKMRVIAEGVETKAAYLFLKEIGCELGQGHYFCKPLPIAACEDRFKHKRLDRGL